MRAQIIAFTGNGPGAGKTECADYIVNELIARGYDAKKVKLADPIYTVMNSMCENLHITFEKNTLRPMMQFIGQFFRENYGSNFWVAQWSLSAKTHLMFSKGTPIVVVDDVRYDNEALEILASGGINV